MKKLSSNATTFLKVIFPVVWLLGFGVASFVAVIRFDEKIDSMDSLMLFPCFLFFGFLLFAFSLFQIKHAHLSGSCLIIRGLGTEVEIPISDILLVRCTSMQNPEMITLECRQTTAFGRKIKFVPKIRFVRFRPHPTLIMLRELIADVPCHEKSIKTGVNQK